MKHLLFALAMSAALCPLPAAAQSSSVDQKLDALQQQIERLNAEVSRLRGEQAAAPAPQANPGSAAAASSVPPAPAPATSLFGYGEFNYNRYRDPDRTSKADLRRFVFGLGHDFSDRLSFSSEVEFEHAVVSKDDEGEAEIEQAYLNYAFSDQVNAKGGLFLIPLGLLNLTHEPTAYYGVERNEVETRIIPTTWRELGVGVHGIVGQGFKYDAGLTTGFNAAKLDDPSFGIASAHQEGQLADAHDLSWYAALNYFRPGLLVGGGVFSGNTGQNGQANPAFQGIDARLTLWDVHAKYAVRGWDLQALYAKGKLGDADQLNAALLATPGATPFAFPQSLMGWYAQAAYHFYRRGNLDVAPFARYERFEIRQQEDPANGLFQDPNNLDRVRTFGVNVMIDPQVVIKADIQRYSVDRTKDRFDIGLGYVF